MSEQSESIGGAGGYRPRVRWCNQLVYPTGIGHLITLWNGNDQKTKKVDPKSQSGYGSITGSNQMIYRALMLSDVTRGTAEDN